MTSELPNYKEELRAEAGPFANALKGEYIKRVWDPDFPQDARNRIIECLGTCCGKMQVEMIGGPDPDIDTFIEKFTNVVPPGVRKLQRIGDSLIYYEFDAELLDPEMYRAGKCPCLLVREGLVPPSPELCKESLYFEKFWVEAVVKHPVQVDLIDSPLTTGSSKCRWVIHLKVPVFTSGELKKESA